MMQTQRAPVQIQNYLYEPNFDTLPTLSQCGTEMDSKRRNALLNHPLIQTSDFSLHELHGQRYLMSLVRSYKGTKGLNMKG